MQQEFYTRLHARAARRSIEAAPRAGSVWFGGTIRRLPVAIRIFFIVALFLFVGAGIFTNLAWVQAQSATTYYVDCEAGQDQNSGTTTGQAWKTIAKANNAALQPGDNLLLKRGCAWNGPLRASWNGTAEQPITIGAYSTGERPRIQDSFSGNVQISGSYQIIDNIEITLTTPPAPDPLCEDQPVGWKVGYAFQKDAAYNTVQNGKVTKVAIGVYFHPDSHHNRVFNNTITDNNVAWEMKANDTRGATGILLQGDSQEIAHNFFANNRPICTYNGVTGGISIELYMATNSVIRHNVSYQDRKFSELGSSANRQSANNIFAYNLFVANIEDSPLGARFLVTRGWGHTHGPVLNTQAYNNSVYIAGNDNKAVTCGMCGNDILTLKNNILWSREPVWSDVPFNEGHNILWDSNGSPLINIDLSPTSLVADPGFVHPGFFDPDSHDFRLQSHSPAIDAGTSDSIQAGFTFDLDAVTVPVNSGVDIGAYEFAGDRSATPTSEPTVEPTPEPTPTAPPDATPMVPCAITINDGALYTDERAIQVRTNVPDAAEMIISNDAGFAGVGWQAYQTQFAWDLRDTEDRIATLVVYARFVDGGGTPLCGGVQISDDIIYDPVPPTVSVSTTDVTEAGGAEPHMPKTVHLWIDAQDQPNGSGVEQMQISLEKHFGDAVWQPVQPTATMSARSGQRIYVRVQDGAGNVSETASTLAPGAGDLDYLLFLPLNTNTTTR